MEKKVKISLKYGKEVFLADLQVDQLDEVILQEKDGKTWLTMKSELVSETDTHFTERRLYKWNVMPALVMYEVKYAKTLKGLEADLGTSTTYNHAMRDFIIAQDKVHNGIVAQGTDPLKAGNKLYASLDNMKDEKGNPIPKKDIEALKKQMQACGFGK